MSLHPPYRLHRSLGYRLSLAARVQERRLEEGLKQIGLTRVTWCVLLAVGNERLCQPSDIADFVGVDRTAASRALRQMEEAGLIERATGGGDRRTRTVTLTGEGREKLQQGTVHAMANNQVLADRLSEDERQILFGLLEKTYKGEDMGLAKF